jgi:hypothetical protein
VPAFASSSGGEGMPVVHTTSAPSSCRLEDNSDLLAVYHEILVNEIALMRANTIVGDGVDTGDVIVYTSNYITHSPRADRGLDYLILAYSIINGFRRLTCGYDIRDPLNPQGLSECRNEIIRKMKEVLGSASDNLARLVAMTVFRLMECGLLYFVLDKDGDTVSPLKEYLRSSPQQIAAPITDIRELYSLRLYHELRRYSETIGTNPGILVDEFKTFFRGQTGVDMDSSFDVTNLFFKTLHGMLFKYASYASALPTHPAVLEANILPFMIEPLPFSKDHSGTSLEEQLSKLSEKAEPCIGSQAFNILEEALKEALDHPLSKFQYKNLQDMFEKCSRGGGLLAVLNSPTGTGKTLVFFTYLLAKLISARISGKPMKALILYPRKALARDQLGKMLEFLDKVNEKMVGRRLEPLRIAIYDGDRLKHEQQGLQSLRDLKLRGHRLCHGFENGVYKVFLVKSNACDEGQRIEDINWVMDVGDDGVFEKADIVVTNHSMLTKLINNNFVRDDRTAFNKFVKGVGILILDEAHIYLGEALEVIVPTLLKLLYLKARLTGKTPNCIKELAEGLDADFIVSSATLTDSDIIVKTVRDGKVGAREERLNSSNVIGFFKVKTRYRNVEIPAPLEEFLRTLLTREVYDKFKTHNLLVYNDYDAIISEGIKDHIWRGHFKLRIALVSHPHPQKESWTSLAETLIAVLHWLNAIRLHGLSEKAQALVFIDSKKTLRHIYRLFLKRQILEAQDHADRTLLTGKYDKSQLNNEPRKKAISATIESINALIKQGRVKNTLDILYRETTFKDFQVLHLYITPQDLNKLKARINSYDDLMKTIENLRSYDGLKRLIDSLNNFANTFKQEGWNAYDDEDKLTKLVNSSEHVILAHYGDLEPPQRAIIEGCMKGDRNPTPLVTLSTSTLELGVDIESLALTIQYASYPYPADLAQRFGRSGRHASSFFVSTLLLVLRNTGEDIKYVSDQDAVEYVYNLKIPPIAYVLEDVDAIVRSLAPTVLSRTFSSNQEDIVEGFLRMLGCEHDGRYNRRFREWRGLIIVAKSQSQVDNLNQVLDKASSVLARIGEHLNNRGLKDLRDEVDALKEELVAIKNLNRKGLHVNLIPYIIRLIALYETLKDQTQAIPHEFLNDIVGIIQDLVGYMQATLEPQLQDEALRFVLSHIPPGATDVIGGVKAGHSVYSLYSPKKKPELLSTDEAFKRIRPLLTGA